MRVHFIQHVHFESPGYLLQWATEHQFTISFTKIYEAVTFPSADDIDWLVIMGGPMGVYEEDKYAWLKAEKAFIRSVIEAGKKVLGICLGSQLIAEVAGAKVYPNHQKEIGWWPVKKVSNGQPEPLPASRPDEFLTFHWHGDTFDLPAGATHLFATTVCPHQGYLLNKNVAGLQFHPEATPELIDNMIAHGQDELVMAPFIQPAARIQELTAQYAAVQHQYLATFLQAFLSR
jgi:GMP synthase-like glutamine amidotransferase